MLTQYQPFELNEYIGNGQPWDLDRLNGGVFVLPPYMKSAKSDWYKGTANAIYQNIDFIDKFSPEYVLVLSGDHIYKMDYSDMLDFHKSKGADCTIAVINVSLEEASRFGIMNTKPDGSVYEFEEKPKKPKSTNASMGIYIFKWQVLRKYLIDDEANPDSHNDFGKDVIPAMLNTGRKLFAYRFDGYWKDVGTIKSLWEANMDLIDRNSGLNIEDSSWKIYARNAAEPPHFVGDHAEIVNSLVTEGCEIDGTIRNSVISSRVEVQRGAIVEDSNIMPGAVVKEGAKVYYAIVGDGAIIEEGAVVGEAQDGIPVEDVKITVVGPGAVVKKGTVVPVAAMVD